MGTNELVEKILADGKARVASIAAEREKAVAETQKRAAADVKAIESARAEHTRHETDAIIERAHSRARLEKRNAILAARWQVLDRAVSRAQEKVLADPGYAGALSRLARKNVRSDSVVSLSEADTGTLGPRLGVKLGKPAAITGGVIIRTGKEELSFSLGEALQALRDDLARDLSRLLFEN